MKTFQKIIGTAAAALLILMPSFTAKAETPRITFTNSPIQGTALYVTKKVICRDEGIRIPSEDSFLFRLKLNGAAVKNLEYHLYRDGTEVFNLENKLPVPFFTDRNGYFALKAEETACFRDMEAGVYYEISESPVSNYTQTEPKGNTASVGTLTKEGASVTFQNLYAPPLPEQSDYTSIEIQKDIAFPYGYELPQTPDFSFRVKIKEKDWCRKPVTILENQSKKIVSSGLTDDKGCFLMKGGCTARLEGIPTGADYEITETDTDGWRKVSNANTKGETTSPVTSVHFTNTEASFVVSKQMDDFSKNNTSFPFELKKSGGAWADAEYYLYNRSGTLLDREKHKTDALGKFSLHSEQSAVFIGAVPGTDYSVMELPVFEYIPVIPQNGGYSDKTVSDSIEILPFVNHYELSTALNLHLIKKGENEVPLSGAVFELYTDKELTQLIETAVSSETGVTRFDELKPGTYYVKEAVSPNGYQLFVNPLKISLTKDSITINDKVYNGTDESSAAYFKDTADGRTVYVTVYNYKGFSLPVTGGRGVGLHILFSMAGAAVLSWLFQKKCSC